MKRLLLIFMAVCLLTTVKSQTVYVAGCEYNEDSKGIIKVWKDGTELHTLTDGTKYVTVNSIYVADNNVYVAGGEQISGSKYIAKIWKNGDLLYSFGNGSYEVNAKDIHVSGTDVYIAGTEYSSTGKLGKVWKNGEVLYSLTGSNNDAKVSAMYVSGNDIYVCGQMKGSDEKYRDMTWKNGSQLFKFGPTSMTTSSNYYSEAYDIVVSGNMVYVSGYTNASTSEAVIYRYNGSSATFQHTYEAIGRINPSAYAYSIDISDNNIYAVVTSGTDKVYKNSSELYSFEDAKISDISVKSGNVYLAGDESDVVKVWKNGEVLHTLTDGSKTAGANAIFVVPTTTGINDVTTQVKNFTVYPNPIVNGMLKIEINSLNSLNALCVNEAKQSQIIQLYDLNGKLMDTYPIAGKTTKINISHLPAGTYWIKVGNETTKVIQQ